MYFPNDNFMIWLASLCRVNTFEKKIILFACSGWVIVTRRVSLYGFSASTDKILYNPITPYFMYKSSNLRS